MDQYRKWAGILAPILLIALIVAIAVGYHGQRDRGSTASAEVQYERAFNELTEHIDQLEDEIGKTLAVNSRRQASHSLSHVWRLAYAAQGDLSQLPLSWAPTDETEKFLYDIGDLAYRTAVRDDRPLSAEEYRNLAKFYQQAGQIQRRLQDVQQKWIQDDKTKWKDVAAALRKAERSSPNSRGANDEVKHYPELDVGRTVGNLMVDQRIRTVQLTGKTISANEAKQRAFRFPSIGALSDVTATLSGGNYNAYRITGKKKNGTPISLEVTQRGGHVVWMDSDREVSKKKLNIDAASQRALQFLHQINHKHMVPISYTDAGNTMVLAFVREENGVRYYPETVAVKVALDNGEIIGFDGDEYVFNQVSESVKQRPKLSRTAARAHVSPRLNVQQTHLAVTYNDLGKKVLCYEFLGNLADAKNDTYRVFINAVTGEEERVDKLQQGDDYL